MDESLSGTLAWVPSEKKLVIASTVVNMASAVQERLKPKFRLRGKTRPGGIQARSVWPPSCVTTAHCVGRGVGWGEYHSLTARCSLFQTSGFGNVGVVRERQTE